jgi:four helix bundle protein
MAIQTFRDLLVWQKAMVLVTNVYSLAKRFPKDELFGLTSQMRRSAVSVPSNIAEGYGRRSTQDYVRFLQISLGSLYELQTQLEIAGNLGYVSHDETKDILSTAREIERMLTSLSGKIRF